jgi:rRNA maturation endonuclease Nob1
VSARDNTVILTLTVEEAEVIAAALELHSRDVTKDWRMQMRLRQLKLRLRAAAEVIVKKRGASRLAKAISRRKLCGMRIYEVL